MLSGKIDKISTSRNENTENTQNNEINNFSRNFNKYYQKLINFQENNNKYNNNNSLIKEKKINNKKSNTTIKENKNNSLINSLFEFDLINNNHISQNQNIKNDSQPKVKQTKKSPVITNNSFLILSNSSRDYYISSTNVPVQTTTVQSSQIKNLKNKYLNSKKKTKLIKSKTMKNLKKCSFSQTKFESFLERTKERQKKKEFHLNNMKCKSLENEISEMNTHPEISKKSLKLLKNNKARKPLYQQKPLIEENNLDKNFKNFYNKTLRENQTNTFNEKYKMHKMKNNLKDIYNKFYEDKIKWKKFVEQKTKNRKLNIEQENEEFIETFPFKPHINKTSLDIVKKLNRNRSIENFGFNNFYENGNERESLDKFKAKLKPIINDYYNYKNNYPKIRKKYKILKKNLSEINIHQIIKSDRDSNEINKNNRINKNKLNKKKPKINYKLTEKKYLNYKNKDKLKNDELFNLNGKDYYLLKQLERTKNTKKVKNKGEDLYKLNIRPGTAWNKDTINKITPLKECDTLIEELL